MAVVESLKRKLLYRLFRQTWNIGVTNHPVAVVAGLHGSVLQQRALDEVQWMDEVRGTFKADPFIAPGPNGVPEMLIFYEHFDWREEKGRIDAVPWDGQNFGRAQLSLQSPHHLSYPYVYAEEGAAFYLPEHAEAQDVSLYNYDEDGRATSKKTILPRHKLVDSTLVRHGGKHWLFATCHGDAVNSDLYIFHADSLSGPWRPHALNPVKSDRANSRPAGQPFEFKNALFRPAQNCSRSYGENIVVNRVITLSEIEFVEVPETTIRSPDNSPYDFGLHTVSHFGDRTVIDGARMESKVHRALDRFSSNLRER